LATRRKRERAPETELARLLRWIASGFALCFLLSPALLYVAMIIALGTAIRCETAIGESIEPVPLYSLEFRGTLCSGFGASYTIEIFALGRRPETEKLIFSYDPFDATPPDISVVGPNRIRISLARASQVYQRLEKWRDLEIEYEIGHITYPADVAQRLTPDSQ
jgi:hypothetical protein